MNSYIILTYVNYKIYSMQEWHGVNIDEEQAIIMACAVNAQECKHHATASTYIYRKCGTYWPLLHSCDDHLKNYRPQELNEALIQTVRTVINN